MRAVRDYTTRRVGSRTDRGRRIERCPECGRKGEAVTYRSGERNFVHRSTFDGLMWTVEASDHCFIPADCSCTSVSGDNWACARHGRDAYRVAARAGRA